MPSLDEIQSDLLQFISSFGFEQVATRERSDKWISNQCGSFETGKHKGKRTITIGFSCPPFERIGDTQRRTVVLENVKTRLNENGVPFEFIKGGGHSCGRIIIEAYEKRIRIEYMGASDVAYQRGEANEIRQRDRLNDAIQDTLENLHVDRIYIDNGRGKYVESTNVIHIAGKRPKADIVINGPEPIFISLKAATAESVANGKPSMFQQYGGVTKRAGAAIHNHPFIQQCIADVKTNVPVEMPNGVMYISYTPVPKDLACLSMYGKQFGEAEFSLNNVNYLMHGNVELIPERIDGDVVYCHLEASAKTFPNGYYPDIVTENRYMPYFAARYQTGMKNAKIMNCRMGIWPNGILLCSENYFVGPI